MIVLEDQQQSKDSTSVAGPTNRASEPYSRNSVFSLPDYETSESQASFPPLKKTEIHLSFIATLRSDRRFWRAVCCAFLIYLVISVAVGVPLIIMVRILSTSFPSSKTWILFRHHANVQAHGIYCIRSKAFLGALQITTSSYRSSHLCQPFRRVIVICGKHGIFGATWTLSYLPSESVSYSIRIASDVGFVVVSSGSSR
jgi:hypothetical protein